MKGDRVHLMFRALSDRTRVRILHLLGRGQLCVGDLLQVLGVPQAKVSRHLAYLRRAGLVRGTKRGLWVFYSLVPAGSLFHEDLLRCLASCSAAVPDLAKDSKKAEKLRRSGGCCPS